MTSKRFILLLIVALLITPFSNAQSVANGNVKEDRDQLLAAEKLSLLADLQSFDEQALNLAPLSRACVMVEIADAAWLLDREWAKALLRKAYELTFPSQEERDKLPKRVIGSPPIPSAPADRASRTLRNHVLQIAAREKAFADQLLRSGLKELGNYELQMTYASLADNARQEHDMDAASKYLLQAVDIDPSQITAGSLLVDIAKTDRVRADGLIVEYLDRLSRFPLSRANGSVFRIYYVVNKLAFPAVGTDPPSPLVMRAYVTYVIHSFGSLEDREPGSLAAYRTVFLRAWLPLKQYAPDLTTEFMILEQRSRGSNESASLPTAESQSKTEREDNENRAKDTSDGDQPNEVTVNRAISQGNFSKARKLMDKMPDGIQKTQFADLIDSKEALYFLKKDDFPAARQLALKLRRASSIREVYLALIGKCVSDKDQICGTGLMLEATKQLKQSDAQPQAPLAGLPSSTFATSADFDPVLDGMAKLTLAVFPISYEIALVGLGETVASANVSQIDTKQGRLGFDVSIFKKLSGKDQEHVRQEAESFKDPSRRLASLAAIYQWNAGDLDKRLTVARSEKTKAVR